MKIMSAKEIFKLNHTECRRLIVLQQLELARHERGWAGAGSPQDMMDADDEVSAAEQTAIDLEEMLKREP